jgi:hypothetical protein
VKIRGCGPSTFGDGTHFCGAKVPKAVREAALLTLATEEPIGRNISRIAEFELVEHSIGIVVLGSPTRR